MNLNSPRSTRNGSCSGLTLLAALLLVLASTGSAIARQAPASWDSTQRTSIESIETAAFGELDLDAIAAEDQLNQAFGKPPRFAIPNEVSIKPLLHGNWSESGEISIWQYRVSAEMATSLNFGFDQVFMPEGAKLYIYTIDAASRGEMDIYEVLGPYSTEINETHRQFWTPIIQGKDVIIELNVPTTVRDQVSFELTRVNQGYRGFGEALEGYFHTDQLFGEGKQSSGDCAKGGGGRSGSCNMDVACLANDDPWNDPRRSVGAYIISGSGLCTGSLVGNTVNDRRMLFMTATHCSVNANTAPSIVVYWNYEWPTCRTPGDPSGTQVGPRPDTTNMGAIWLASTEDPFNNNPLHFCSSAENCSDTTIIELDDPANPDFDLFWAGWDRRSLAATCGPQGATDSTSGLCASIHHPSGDEKRITFVETDFVIGNIGLAQNVHWTAFWHQNPPILANIPAPQPTSIPPQVTEQGSSGSPLYNSNQQLIGVLSGGASGCGVPPSSLNDEYGALFHAWDGLGTPTTRVSDYLDPLGMSAEFIDGIDEAPFTIETTPGITAVCTTDESSIFSVNVGQFEPNFTAPVTLSVLDAPTGSSISFDTNPVIPNGSSELTIGNLSSTTPGEYLFIVRGDNSGFQDNSLLSLSLADETPVNSNLLEPANGATNVSPLTLLSWEPVDTAISYSFEIADNPDFVNPIFTTSTTSTEVSVSDLGALTEYFWRVTAENACGAGAPSAIFSFTTANQFCSAPGNPLLDPDAGGGSAFDSIITPQAGPAAAVTVSVDLEHTFVGDTRLVLSHVDSGTSVTLYDRPGVPASDFGCPGNNIVASFSDSASVLAEDECVDETPGLSGDFLPIDPMNTFDGLSSNAEWRLEYYDDEPAGTDVGELTSWCISLEALSEEIFADGFETPAPPM